MPRPAQPWFRMWSDLAYSLKFDELPDRLVKPWLKLICLANVSEPRGSLPSMAKVAHHLRIKEPKAQALCEELYRLRWLDLSDGVFSMHDWDDWQRPSDANLTPGRAEKTDVGRHEERRSAGINPPNERATNAEARRIEEKSRSREEGEQSRRDADARAPEHPFAITFAREYADRHAGRPPAPTTHAAALALEREFGADACIQAARDYDWQKHPNYLRPVLEERRNGKPGKARNTSGRGARSADSSEAVTAGWDAYKAGDG